MKNRHFNLILFLVFFFYSCSSAPTIIDKNASLDKLIGKRVTVTGKAVNAKLGALLILGDGTRIWIDEKLRWPEGYYLGDENGKTLKVTGKLIKKSDLPVFESDENAITLSRMPVPKGTDLQKARQRFLLKDISWEIIQE